MGATLRGRRHAARRLADGAEASSACEGFDVGLEMSGNPQRLRDMLANMCHGGRIAMLGIPTERDRDRLEHRSIFNMLTIKGIYGREMYETWYKMTAMLQGGLDIRPVHHPPLPIERVPEGLRPDGAAGSAARSSCDWT